MCCRACRPPMKWRLNRLQGAIDRWRYAGKSEREKIRQSATVMVYMGLAPHTPNKKPDVQGQDEANGTDNKSHHWHRRACGKQDK